MKHRVAIIGAGVTGLTTGVVFAENGYEVAIFADKVGQQTTSGAAAAIWFPYDAEPTGKVIPWALSTYRELVGLSREPQSGVSMIEIRHCSRTTDIEIPKWARELGALAVATALCAVGNRPQAGGYNFKSGFSMNVPLTDTTIYLDYLANRFRNAGGAIKPTIRFARIEDVDPSFDLVLNCAGIGARDLVRDWDLVPHRGQVAIVPKIDKLECAIVCDDAPLMYAIPRTNDCVFGGTNDVSSDLTPDPSTTVSILEECGRVLNVGRPEVLAERVGLRPFRKSGIRLELEQLGDGRNAVHNYGHGGAGFTLSWGCARQTLELVTASGLAADASRLEAKPRREPAN